MDFYTYVKRDRLAICEMIVNREFVTTLSNLKYTCFRRDKFSEIMHKYLSLSLTRIAEM